MVNYIPISIVQKTLKEHNTILSINKGKSVVKCKCLKIAMELFTFWLLYGLIFDWLLGYITVMVNIKWLEDIVCLRKCATSLKEENGYVFNTGLLSMSSRISLFFSQKHLLLFVYFHLIFISCVAISGYSHTEIVQLDEFFHFPFYCAFMVLLSTFIMLVWQTTLPPKEPVYSFNLGHKYIHSCADFSLSLHKAWSQLQEEVRVEI